MEPLDVGDLFPHAAGYLNTTSLGLPPTSTIAAMEEALQSWRRGSADPVAYDDHVEESRRLFARLVNVPPEWVAVGSQVSGFVGLVAASLPPGATVLLAEEDFTSVLFPFQVQEERGVRVRFVPLDRLADAITPEIDLVACSAVQSADGRVADLDRISEAARANRVITVVDGTQAVGWWPFDASQFDVVVTGAYKWLLSPRGTAFMTVRPDRLGEIVPHHAGWYAGDDRWASIYGPPLRLANDARRFDLSPAWLSWVGTAPSLRLLAEIGIETVHRHDVGLAQLVRDRLQLEPSPSAVVTIDLPPEMDATSLPGVTAAMRAGKLRVSFHLYNTSDDVERLLSALPSP